MMAPVNALNNVVKPSLIKDIGVSLSTLVILQKAKERSVTMFALDKDGYAGLVEAIASDERVKKAVGDDGAELRKREWLAAVG